ncbi:hypothetical protein [Amycolatopsis dendrobii]|uniref:VWFA domain-containing protein n=1 Tax=Amycolatopsis dendrobii TaxID=2760662 RepID=A0A7W3VSM6_9PSEU|nr:hypothetical protein [Amycolatopsis dendrobii]MBB1152469.1 hypothetical protein [Amycolatopsis dendrobii]
MSPSTDRRCFLSAYVSFLSRIVVVLLAAVLAVTACGAPTSAPNDLATNQQRLTQCDPARPPAALVAIDGTGSSASDQIAQERMQVVEAIATRTAVCGGHLRVLVFTASSAAATVLFDGSLKMAGATDNARLRRVPAAVAELMATVRAAYAPTVAALPRSASDITAQYRLASEWVQQLGGPYRLDFTILTDGFQNVRVDLGARALSKQEAAALADQETVPTLSGASVTAAGLGRIANGTPSSSVVEGLVAYYDELCRHASAVKCTSVTDYAEAAK